MQLLFDKIFSKNDKIILSSCRKLYSCTRGLLPWPSLYITRNPKASPPNAVLAKSGAIRLS